MWSRTAKPARWWGTWLRATPDAGDTLAFSLADGTGAFAVDESGQITVADATQLDAETTASFDLDVTVTDGKGLGAAAVVTVNLTGLNEVPPVVEDQAFDVDENSGNGTVVGTVVASDADVGDALTYAIVGGTGAFAIDEDSGELTVADAGQLDFEASTGFSLDVAVTDGGGLVDDAVITVAVNGVNEAPVVDDQSFSVAENSANGTSVGTVTAGDRMRVTR